jgi:hypothetical protein
MQAKCYTYMHSFAQGLRNGGGKEQAKKRKARGKEEERKERKTGKFERMRAYLFQMIKVWEIKIQILLLSMSWVGMKKTFWCIVGVSVINYMSGSCSCKYIPNLPDLHPIACFAATAIYCWQTPGACVGSCNLSLAHSSQQRLGANLP